MPLGGGWIDVSPNDGGAPSGPAGGDLFGTYPNPSVVAATETNDGIAEIATQAETDAGTDDTRFVTPLKLANYPFPTAIPATETVAGIAEIATQAEVNTGTDDTRFITPLKLANAVGIIDHGNLAGLADDDHVNYFYLPGRIGGQTGYGGTASGNELVLFGSTHPTLGRIRFRSPVEIGLTAGAGVEAGDPVALRYRPTFTASSPYIGGVLASSATVTVATPTFIWASLITYNRFIQSSGLGFAAYTVMNALSVFDNGTSSALLNALVLNVGVAHRRITSGTGTIGNVTGLNFSPQLAATASGATMTRTNAYGVRVTPTWNSVFGSVVNLGNVTAVQCSPPSQALFGSSAGTETLTNYIGIQFDNITFPSSGIKAVINCDMTDAADRLVVNNPGGARSDWGGGYHYDCGDIEILADNLALILGSGNDIRINWNGTGLEYNPVVGDDLRWTFGTNSHILQSANFTTASELRMGFDRFAFGQTGAVGNQVGVFVAPARATGAAGGWSDFLLTQAGNLTLDHAMTELHAWTINALSISAGTGSLTGEVSTLNVGGMTTSGLGSNPTSALRVAGRQVLRGSLNLAPITATQLTADVDNYTGMGTGSLQRPVLRVSSDAARTISGFDIDAATVRENDTIFVVNVGANNVILGHEDTGSDAENRIISPTGADYPLIPDAGAMLWYDDTSDRWRLLYAAGTTVPATPAYSPSNALTDRTFDANSTTVNELADVIATMIVDLQAAGIFT